MKSASKSKTAKRAEPVTDTAALDTSYLEGLLGYNARRAALTIIGVFLERMAAYELRPVEFSVASLICRNPGVTSRQLCTALGLLPPNLVAMVSALEQRGLIVKRPHPSDGRATGLHPTEAGIALLSKAEQTATQLESDVGSRLSAPQRDTLIRLLKKVYLP